MFPKAHGAATGMKNASIVVLSILLVLALLWVYTLKSELKSATEPKKLAVPALGSEADKACHDRAQAHYRAGDIEGGDLASAQCYDPALFEEKNQKAWLAEYRRNHRTN